MLFTVNLFKLAVKNEEENRILNNNRFGLNPSSTIPCTTVKLLPSTPPGLSSIQDFRVNLLTFSRHNYPSQQNKRQKL